MNLRADLEKVDICDISYTELVAAPLRTTQKIYERFGLQWTREVESNIKNVLNVQNDRGNRPQHRYRCEDFGISAEEIDRKFASYSEAFSDYLD